MPLVRRRALGTWVAIAGLAAFLAGTDPTLGLRYDSVLTLLCILVSLFFAVQLIASYWMRRSPDANGAPSLWRTLLTPLGLIDLAAGLSVPMALALGASHLHARTFGVLWSLKLIRSSPAFGLLRRVLRNERQSLASVAVAFLIVLIFAATAAFLIEGPVQPENFGSVPAALWWAVTTLTTTGYGDKIPATFVGRLLAGAVMVCGIGLFALWAGILSTGFAEEIRRSEFLKAWDVVVRFPMFRDLGASALTEITRMLKVQDFPPGSFVVRQGEPGDSMYFVCEGKVEVQLASRHIHLGPGSFFGEMALVTREPRNATIRAVEQVRLLRLDVVHFRELAARNPTLLAAIEATGKERSAG